MTEMIEVLRGYEAYQKIIRTLDESAGQVINGVGTPT
jgi:flagellar basal body rod protein FlgG